MNPVIEVIIALCAILLSIPVVRTARKWNQMHQYFRVHRERGRSNFSILTSRKELIIFPSSMDGKRLSTPLRIRQRLPGFNFEKKDESQDLAAKNDNHTDGICFNDDKLQVFTMVKGADIEFYIEGNGGYGDSNNSTMLDREQAKDLVKYLNKEIELW